LKTVSCETLCCDTYSPSFKVVHTSWYFLQVLMTQTTMIHENPFISSATLLIPPPRHMSLTKVFLRTTWFQTLITKR